MTWEKERASEEEEERGGGGERGIEYYNVCNTCFVCWATPFDLETLLFYIVTLSFLLFSISSSSWILTFDWIFSTLSICLYSIIGNIYVSKKLMLLWFMRWFFAFKWHTILQIKWIKMPIPYAFFRSVYIYFHLEHRIFQFFSLFFLLFDTGLIGKHP